MASTTPTPTIPDYPDMGLPVPTFSYPVLREVLHLCGANLELSTLVLQSYFVVAIASTAAMIMEEEFPVNLFPTAEAGWIEAVEAMYRLVPGLARGAVQEPVIVFREILESIDAVGDAAHLRPLMEKASYQGSWIMGCELFIIKALHMQESAFLDGVIHDWLICRVALQLRLAQLGGGNEDGDEDEWEVFEPGALTDIGFEPSGPRLQVKDIAIETRVLKNPTCDMCREGSEAEDKCGHSTCNICLERLDMDTTDQSQTPMEVRCGHAHSFHYECLGDLINGISDFSNLCPTCRGPICERRARTAIAGGNQLNDRVDAALAAEDSSSDDSDDGEMVDIE